MSAKDIGQAIIADLGSDNKLSRQAISKGCNSLVDEGLIDETDNGPGKPKLWQAHRDD